MFVEQILPRARERLAIVASGALVAEAAEVMTKSDTDLVIVCDGGVMVGVLTKTDIVSHVFRPPLGAGFQLPVDDIMTREVASCRIADPLHNVWEMMSARSLRRIPVLDAGNRPIGVVYTRDALQGLLTQVEIEEDLLRDYIDGVGYR